MSRNIDGLNLNRPVDLEPYETQSQRYGLVAGTSKVMGSLQSYIAYNNVLKLGMKCTIIIPEVIYHPLSYPFLKINGGDIPWEYHEQYIYDFNTHIVFSFINDEDIKYQLPVLTFYNVVYGK